MTDTRIEMSKTPRTDAESEIITDEFGAVWEAVTADFARELERQLAEARKDLELLSQPEALRHEMLKEAMKDSERLDWLELNAIGMMGADRLTLMARNLTRQAIDSAMEESK